MANILHWLKSGWKHLNCKVCFFIALLAAIQQVSICIGADNEALQGKPVDRIVAIVNEDIITSYELDQTVKPYEEKIKGLGYSIENEHKMLFKVRQDVLNQLIDEKLTDQEVKRINIDVSEKEVDEAIERIKAQSFLSDEDLRQALAKEGYSMEDYRKRTREQILRSKLVSYRIKSKIVVTDEEVRAYYENNRKTYLGETKYHLRNIIMPTTSMTEEAKANVYHQMETILELLAKGQPFEILAAKYSKSSLAAEGGNLGLFRLEDLAPKMREAVKDLKPGEHSSILDTDQGYQIMYVENIVHTKGKTLEEATPEIQEKLYTETLEKEFQTWLSDLRKQSHIKIIQ